MSTVNETVTRNTQLIFSNTHASAVLKSDGSIATWGAGWAGGTGAPTDAGFTQVFSTAYAFAALKSDGSITAWGGSASNKKILKNKLPLLVEEHAFANGSFDTGGRCWRNSVDDLTDRIEIGIASDWAEEVGLHLVADKLRKKVSK